MHSGSLRPDCQDQTVEGLHPDSVASAKLLPARGARLMRCSELSLELQEPLLATAPVAARWELVERPKPWGREHGLEVPGAKVLLVQRVSGSEPQSPAGG